MTEKEITRLTDRQRVFFSTGATLDISFRIRALEKLRASILKYESEILSALSKDLGKGCTESYMCEAGLVLSEIRYMRRHIRSLAKERTVHTPLAQFPSRSFQKPSPYGTVLIMSPWNYPFLLTLDPLVDALAAGNTVVLKPSAYSPATSRIISRIIAECFDESYVSVVTGGRAENACLLREHFDYIFFTGSQSVGRKVMRHAAERLTPVTLELGGKSPCIVDKSARIPLAARRIVFGKYLNCGQTCVAPDYILCHEDIKEELIFAVKKEITRQFGRYPLGNPDYGKIINERHFHRILGLIDPQKLVWGGEYEEASLRIAPAVMADVTWKDAVMQEEIFGPVLPILTYRSLEQAIRSVESRPHPLALYLFSEEKAVQKKVLSRCRFGGGCINDTVIHLAGSAMPFGGVGESGMGCYHGKEGFLEFSHVRSIVEKKTWMDLPVRYQPYDKWKTQIMKFFLR